MPKHTEALIAHLLDEAPLPAGTRRWLQTPEGQRERQAYQQVLGLTRQLYGTVEAAPAEVYYSRLEAPLGTVHLAATAAGLVRVGLQRSRREFLRELRAQLPAKVVESEAPLRGALQQMREYLAGRRQAFDLPVDLRLATPFQRRVLLEAARIPRGRTATYAEVARRLGRPGAARAVGQALSHNPVPIVIPCHRVRAADGSLRGYLGGGVQLKAQLLSLEGVRL